MSSYTTHGEKRATRKKEMAAKMIGGKFTNPYGPDNEKNKLIDKNMRKSKKTLASHGKNEGETMMGNNRTERNRS